MDNQTAKGIERSLKNINGALNAISDTLKKMERNTSPVTTTKCVLHDGEQIRMKSEFDLPVMHRGKISHRDIDIKVFDDKSKEDVDIDKIVERLVNRFIEARKADE